MTPPGTQVAPAASPDTPPTPLALRRRRGERRLLHRRHRPPVDAQTLRVVERRTVDVQRSRGRLIRRSLLIGDVLALLVTFAAVELIVLAPNAVGTLSARTVIFAGFAAVLVLVMAANGLYGRDETRADHTTTDDLPAIFHAITATALATLLIQEAMGEAHTTAVLVAAFTALAVIPVTRTGARIAARRRPGYQQKTLVLGAGQIGQLMARKLLTHPEYGLDLVGFADDSPRPLGADVADVPVLGGLRDVPNVVRQHGVERVIVAFSAWSHAEELELIRMLKDLDLQVDIVPRLFEVVGPNADINVFEGMAVFGLPPMRLSRASLIAKRTLDVTVAGLALVALAPLFAMIALAVKLEDGGPLLYRGTRIGPRGRRFGQLKFRSMAQRFCGPDGQEEFEKLLRENPAWRAEFALTQKLADDPRVTRTGRLLRRTSLDELPQLLNVLRGDLSLVGPRPITETELRERYKPRIIDPEIGESLLVGYWDSPGLRPGLTGYWQISGRSTMSFDERIRLDTAYLTSWSLKLDIEILTKTARALFAARGAY